MFAGVKNAFQSIEVKNVYVADGWLGLNMA
jgi:hypothetical protein